MVASATTSPFGGTAHGCAACRQLHADIKVSVTQITDKLDRLSLRVEELFAQKENGTRSTPPISRDAAISSALTNATASKLGSSFSSRVGNSFKKDVPKIMETQSSTNELVSMENYQSKYGFLIKFG